MPGGIRGCRYMRTRIAQALVLATMLIFGAISAYAAAPAGATINSTTSLGHLPVSAPASIDLVSGNITVADLSVTQSTFRWVGLLGNVTGSIKLGDSANNTLYQWAARGNLVYAANSPTINWSNVSDANQASVVGVDPFLSTGTNDAYDKTFTGGPESIGSNIFTISSDYALTSSANATLWKTYSLWDKSSSTLLWVGKVVVNGTSYRNTTVDYQMIIPEDGTAGDTTPTTYYLWVENK